MQNAQVVRRIVINQPATFAPRARVIETGPRSLAEAEGSLAEDPTKRPIVRLPSGAMRGLKSIRVIPRTHMAEVVTVGDIADGFDVLDDGRKVPRSRVMRIPLNTPIMSWNRAPGAVAPQVVQEVVAMVLAPVEAPPVVAERVFTQEQIAAAFADSGPSAEERAAAARVRKNALARARRAALKQPVTTYASGEKLPLSCGLLTGILR